MERKWGGGGKTKSGKEKQSVPTEKSNLKKLKFLEELLEKEKKENERCKQLREKEKSSKIEEEEKRKIRLEIKRTLELKWQTVRWASDHLERNNEEFGELLRDVEKREEEELSKWKKMKRFEKIEKLRQEQMFTTEIDKTDTAWGGGKSKIYNSRKESTTPENSKINSIVKQISSPANTAPKVEGGGGDQDKIKQRNYPGKYSDKQITPPIYPTSQKRNLHYPKLGS